MSKTKAEIIDVDSMTPSARTEYLETRCGRNSCNHPRRVHGRFAGAATACIANVRFVDEKFSPSIMNLRCGCANFVEPEESKV